MAISLPIVGKGQRSGHAPAMRLAALRVPLVCKLVGANVLVVAVFLVAWASVVGTVGLGVLSIAGLLVLVHTGLLLAALRPIRDLEIVASRVWKGDYGARVERSSVADHRVLRVSSMFNILLDALAADRAQMRSLANDVILAGDRERAAIARELHDSAAQRLAAVMYQLGAIARDVEDPATAEQLAAARDSAEAVLEQIREISQTVHSGVLDDLGIEAALRKLARDLTHGNAIDFDVKASPGAERIPANIQNALFRVAQEAARNAVIHALPKRIHISVNRSDAGVLLEVHDDGRGFDLAAANRESTRGLRSMRERLALVDGQLEINTALGNGTTVYASVPLDAA